MLGTHLAAAIMANAAIRYDLEFQYIQVGAEYRGSIQVSGVRFEYVANRYSEEIINVGRITVTPP
jgi:hypothetical protein